MEPWQDWVSLDSAQQKLMMRRALEPLAAFATGVIEDSDRGPYFSGTYDDRRFRVSINETSGTPTLQVEVKNDRGFFSVRFDPSAQQLAPEGGDRSKHIRVFVVPGLFFEDYPADVERQQAMLTPELPALILELLQVTGTDHFDVDDHKIEHGLENAAHVMRGEMTPRIQQALDAIAQITRELGI